MRVILREMEKMVSRGEMITAVQGVRKEREKEGTWKEEGRKMLDNFL